MATWYPVDVQLSRANKKFIDKYYSDRGYKVSPQDMIGPILIGSLRKTPFNFKPQKKNEGTATFYIEQHQVWGRGKFIPELAQNMINKQIDKLFDLNLNTFITLFVQGENNKTVEALAAFYRFFELVDEDIALESLKKRYFRIRKEINDKIINDLEQTHKHFDLQSAVLANRLTDNPLKTKELKQPHIVCPFFTHLFSKAMTA